MTNKNNNFAVVETIGEQGKPMQKRIHKFDTLTHAEMFANDLMIYFANHNPKYRIEQQFLSARMYKNKDDVMFTEQYEIKEL